MIQGLLQKQLDASEAQLDALNAAQLALIAGTMTSYTFDTGQSKITVTKNNIDVLDKMIDSLLNRIATLCARLNGSGGAIAVPKW